MSIDTLLAEARAIWGDKNMSANEIAIALGVVVGDVNRYVRDMGEGQQVNDKDLQKELGNLIFSTIRWCDDLGFDPEACIILARKAQKEYQQRN